MERPRFITGKTVDWPKRVADQVLAAFENKLSIFELCRLNYVAGALYAEAARSLMRETQTMPGALAVIGFDGQTLYQEPADPSRMADFASDEDLVGRWLDGPYPCGLQIAEPSIVAAACDTTVVTQFRTMEHAHGGSGAPLMQFLDFVAFRKIGPVLTLNIGGIANCQLADSDRRRMMAFDTGPGNVMLDHAARVLLGKPYDSDGAAAARGIVDEALLARLLQHDFFERWPPRSAWRLDFGSSFADGHIAENRTLPPEDLLATFAEFTAVSIAQSIPTARGYRARVGGTILFHGVFQPRGVDPRSPPARIRRSCRVQLRWNGVKLLSHRWRGVGLSHRSGDAALNTAPSGTTPWVT